MDRASLYGTSSQYDLRRFSGGWSYAVMPRGAVEVAFDHDNGDVIMETNVAAEVCRAVN